MKQNLVLLVASILVICSQAFAVGELEQRRQIEATVKTMFAEERFEELDALAAGFRSGPVRSPNGSYTLHSFYAGVRAFADWENKNSAYWASLRAKAERWVSQSPRSAASHLGLVELRVAEAWMHRGSGYANTVTPENLRSFVSVLESAVRYMAANRSVASSDPHWYVLLLEIARLLGADKATFKSFLDEGSSRFPHYLPMYLMATEYYLPKWLGSDDDVEMIANYAAERTRATDGWGAYARAFYWAFYSQYRKESFSSMKMDWEKMKRGFSDVLKQHPDPLNIARFAHLACAKGDKALTASLFGAFDGYLEDAWWSRQNYDRCRAWASR